MRHRPASSLSVAGAQHWWTEAVFASRLAQHWPDHHWQYNWQVAQTSMGMCVCGQKATIVAIFSHMTAFVKCDTTYVFFVNYHKF